MKPLSAAQVGPTQPGVDRTALASLTLDEQLLEVAKRDPSFGGMFLDEEGRLTMYVTETALAAQDGWSRLATLSVLIESMFRGDDRIATAAARKINVIPGQFSFAALYDWHQTLTTDVLSIPGVVLTDIAEDQNRLRIGVETPEVANLVMERMAQLGVPSEAVMIQQSSPIQQMAHTLRSRFRGLIGGIQIHFGPGLCTLGFPAIRAGVVGFITNSHCTLIQGGVQNTVFHQPLASGTANRVGLEIRDPAYFTGGVCPAGRRCRYSDSAFVRVPHPSGPATTTARGFIARPLNTGGTLAINHASPTFRIRSENTVPVLNEILNKVGRTTGWSQGKVRITCLNTGVSGTNIVQFCQDIVAARVNSGDSGSPVFRITNSPATGDVRLYGVLWGGGTISGIGTVFAFSALGTRNVQRASEMGTLTTCAPGVAC